MVRGLIIGILELGIYLPFSYFLRKRYNQLQEINAISYYWFMITILTFIWEFSYIAAYDEIENYAVSLLKKNEHVWTNHYDLTYIFPWNLARIFYAEYGAYADREYMSLITDWSKVVESSHAFFCGLFSLFALLLKVNGNNKSFDITLGISMGSQLMNSLLYMVEYYYQVQDKDNVNYPTDKFPCGFAYYKRPFMWVNIFWIIMPTYTIIYSLMEKKLIYKKI